MTIILILFAAMFTYVVMVRRVASPDAVLHQFPEIYYGHTGVYVIEGGTDGQRPSRPAYMVFENRRPIFYDLYTNQTIGTAAQYSKGLAGHPYRAIRFTEPLYKGRTLYDLVTRVKPPRRQVNPTIQKIYARRRLYWWKRLDRHFRELRGENVTDYE